MLCTSAYRADYHCCANMTQSLWRYSEGLNLINRAAKRSTLATPPPAWKTLKNKPRKSITSSSLVLSSVLSSCFKLGFSIISGFATFPGMTVWGGLQTRRCVCVCAGEGCAAFISGRAPLCPLERGRAHDCSCLIVITSGWRGTFFCDEEIQQIFDLLAF